MANKNNKEHKYRTIWTNYKTLIIEQYEYIYSIVMIVK